MEAVKKKRKSLIEKEEEAESRGVLKRKIPFYYIVMVNIYYIFFKIHKLLNTWSESSCDV